MKVFRILFLTGEDRPGIVNDLTTILYKHQVNIEQSHMATMGGRFSVMVLLSMEEEILDQVSSGLDDMRAKGFEISLHFAENPLTVTTGPSLPLKIEARSIDHPGIIKRIVQVFHEYDINITKLESRVTHAPLSGSFLFDLFIESHVPKMTSIAEVKERIRNISLEMNLDIDFVK